MPKTAVRTSRPAPRGACQAHPARAVRPARPTRPGADSGFPLLIGLVALLVLIGLVMVLSASAASPWSSFTKQVIWATCGAIALLVFARVDYHFWAKLAAPALILAVGALTVVLVPGFGIAANGSRRWIGISWGQIQPSEIAKLVFIIFVADLLARRADRMHETRATFRPIAIVTLVLAALVIKEPDMGTAIIICAIAGVMLFVAGSPPRTLALGLGSLAAAGLLIGVVAPYRMARFTSFFHQSKDSLNTGYQAMQGRVGLATGRWFGVGLGAGRVKTGYLPNANTDFIFAVIGEELGFVGCLVVICLFVGVAWIGVRAVARAPDRFGVLLATGITAWIVVQALVNVGAVIGLLPVTGVPLPFVSFGGSSMLITMAAAGLLANVARQG